MSNCPKSVRVFGKRGAPLTPRPTLCYSFILYRLYALGSLLHFPPKSAKTTPTRTHPLIF